MNSTDTGNIKEKILSFFSKHPSDQFKPVEIARRLSIKGETEYRLLGSALNELYQEGMISRGRRKRYGRSTPPSSQHQVGELTVTKQGSGIVRLLAPGSGSVLISQRMMGTALNGDKVKISVFAHPGPLKDYKARPQDMPEGEIIEIVERSRLPIVGIFEKSKNFFFVIPDNRKNGRDIYIPKGKTGGARPGDKVVAQIDSWESSSPNPEGTVLEVLGESGEVRAEMSAVAREFMLPTKFPKEVISEAEKITASIPKEEYSNRLDLRKATCFTVDPEDAKDFDDAVSLDPLSDGNLRLGVHIADVSHFVREGSAIDTEALKRGTSVYLADEVIPMLPEKLSSNLCSLRPRTDRLTYSVLMTVTPKGALQDYQIAKSVIHSKRRFTYEEVQKIIETGKGEFSSTIGQMHALSRTLLKKRMKEGSIDFESAETKFRFDETGKPSEIIKKERLDAHRLIEEFMLLANQVVAKHIGVVKKESNPRPFIYRVHEPPSPERLTDLASFVEHLGYSLKIGGGVLSRAIQKLLDEVKGKEEENVINEVAIRSMAKAVYSEKNTGHFGLGFRYYTHFTSPIRRYPDLVVHRLLVEHSEKMPRERMQRLTGLLPEVCRQSSERERIAMEAERASVKVMQVEYMKRHLGDEFHAIISGVSNYGIFIELADLLVEGLVRVRDMEDDFYVYDEKKYALTGRHTKKRYRLGDKVTVKVVRVDPVERQIDFLLA